MAAEHVVKFRDLESNEERQIDLNNGYIYDADGNSLERATPKDTEQTDMLADYIGARSVQMSSDQLRRAVCFSDRAREATEERAKAAQRTGMQRLMSDRFLKMAEELNLDIGPGDVHIPSAMPNYAAGYHQDAWIADVVSPPILVPFPADKYYTFAKEDAYQRALPQVGAGGAQVPEIAPRILNAQFNSVERALGGFVEHQVEAAADGALKIRQAYADRILTALMLEREIRVAALMSAAGNYDSSVVATIASGSQWDGGASSDPVADLQTRTEQAWTDDLSGTVLSLPLWHAFQRNANVQKYFTFKSGTDPLPTSQKMSSILELPPFYIARARYINSTSGLTFVWGNNALLFRHPNEMPPTNQKDVSTGTTFRWNDTGIPDGRIANGMVIREFYVQGRGSKGGNMIIMVHQDAEVVTSAFAAGLLVNAYQ